MRSEKVYQSCFVQLINFGFYRESDLFGYRVQALSCSRQGVRKLFRGLKAILEFVGCQNSSPFGRSQGHSHIVKVCRVNKSHVLQRGKCPLISLL